MTAHLDSSATSTLLAVPGTAPRRLARGGLAGRASTLADRRRSISTLFCSDLEPQLRALPLFDGVPLDSVSWLTGEARLLTLPAGETIFRDGDFGRELYVVVEGSVHIVGRHDDAEEIVATVGRGGWFGELAAFSGEPRSAAARTATDVRLIMLDQHAFEELISRAPEVAIEICRELSRRLRRELTTRPSAPTARRNENVFRKQGEFWTIAFGGEICHLRDAKGLRYVAMLLGRPGIEIHAVELAGCALIGDAGELVDGRARASYRRRLRDLEDEAGEAARCNDVGRAAKVQTKIDAIVAELSAAFGLGNRARRAASDAERARLMVTQRIKASIGKVRDSCPTLGRHLGNCVSTGLFCAYEPAEPVAWSL